MFYTPPSMYGTKRIQIVKFVLQETGTYNTQWKRPYVSSMDARTFNSIVEASHSSRSITPVALAGSANQFLRPTATPETHLIIPNGWQERRLRFMLELVIEEQMGNCNSEYVVGYTDYAGIDSSGRLDPNMTYIINSVSSARTVRHTTALGNQRYQNAIDASHILVNDNYQKFQTSQKEFTLRPEDIYQHMDTVDISRNEALGDFCDTQTILTKTPIKSRRSNAIAPVYVSSILDTYIKARPNENMMGTEDELLTSARYLIRSDEINNDSFIAFLRNRYSGDGNHFTFADLQALDPNVVNVTHVMPLNTVTRASLHQTGITSDWGASDGETVFATCVSQSLPGYMLMNCVNKLHIQATNRDICGKTNIIVINIRSFMENVDMTPYIQSILFKLENELFRDLSYNNKMDFAIDVKCDLLGETWINLSINSGPFITYVTPSFCDALMSPMVTLNYNNCTSIASDFSNLLSQICDSNPIIASDPNNTNATASGFGLI